ncbi:hypothetical protein STCU_02708 [Strigomonas culicis]|uniref:DUF1935 domain-containing protein n=1 Tax=Strigomonas culicis TaxID=28005 RepID=S9UVD7_9TRYP|nr:hypothetical protein STCU_02708 [Strigomonas culicis]|eukprot:EPY32729.1 hypothetical protein STCU_02708 [Strigomonas culicis]
MRVKAVMSQKSDVRALGNAKLSSISGKEKIQVTLFVKPLETALFVEGTMHGYKMTYDALKDALE